MEPILARIRYNELNQLIAEKREIIGDLSNQEFIYYKKKMAQYQREVEALTRRRDELVVHFKNTDNNPILELTEWKAKIPLHNMS